MSDEDFKWYILQSQSGSEKKVLKLIDERLRLSGKSSEVEEFFVPSEEVKRKRNGKEVITNVTYFPGYILVKMRMSADMWHLFKSIPKVSGFVGGTAKEPKAVSQKELEEIQGNIKAGTKQKEVDSTFQIGQRVTVIEGPFAEFNGTLETVDAERNKLTVLVNIFGRSTPLELDFDKVRIND